MSLARNYFPPVKYGAKWQPSDVVGGGSTAGTYGKVYWCIKSTGGQYERFRDDYDVKYADGNSSVQTSLTTAMALLKNGDVLYLGPGNWTGNYTTPANTVARDVAIIAMNAVSQVGGRTWMGATIASSPIITVQARGWRISGIEFTPGATSSAITLSGTNANYFQVDNCSTFTGKYFLLNGGTHFVKVLNNQIVRLNATGSIGIGALTGIGGQYWEIKSNLFSDNFSHINFGNTGDRGLFSSLIKGNTFIRGGAWTISTTLIDNRSTSDTGGTAIVENYFDTDLTTYSSGAGAMIRTQARDWGAGNWCNDGIPIAAIEH